MGPCCIRRVSPRLGDSGCPKGLADATPHLRNGRHRRFRDELDFFTDGREQDLFVGLLPDKADRGIATVKPPRDGG